MNAAPCLSGKASRARAALAWSRSRPAITVGMGRTAVEERPPENTDMTEGAAMAPPADITTTPSASAMKPVSRPPEPLPADFLI
jgi:hypothetical protein